LVKYKRIRLTKIDFYLMNILQKGNNNFFFPFFCVNFVYPNIKMDVYFNIISRCSFILHYLRILNFKSMFRNLSTVFMLLFGLFQSLNAQQTVKGTILDEKGSPIIAVNVILKGTGTGTVSDLDGKYSLQVPNENAVLEFSFIGYKSKSESVGNRTTIDVTLEEDAELLDEVVVSALGFAQKKDQMGSTYEKDVLTTVKRQPGQKRPNNWFEPVIGLGENHPRIGEFAVDKDGGIVTWAGHAYIVSAVRRRSTFAIKQEAEYFASGKVEELEEAEYPLASYLFAAQSATAKPLSEGMALYCYRNQVSPAVMTLAGHLPLKVFENIKDLPISWVKEFLSEGN
jgi:hypothetical protein